MAENQQPKRPRRQSQIDQWRDEQQYARNRDQKPKANNLPTATMFQDKPDRVLRTAANNERTHAAAQEQRRAPYAPKYQAPSSAARAVSAYAPQYQTPGDRALTVPAGALSTFGQAPTPPAASQPSARQESQAPASGALAAAAPPSAQNPTTRMSGRGGGGNRGRTGHNTPAPAAFSQDMITRLDGSVVPLSQVNQERRALQDSARSNPQAPASFGASNTRGESIPMPQAPGRESAMDRFMRVAREEQLLKQGFLPKGTEVELTPKDRLAERTQAYVERADQRDFEQKRRRESTQDLWEGQKTRAQIDVWSQQSGSADAQRRLALAQLEAETNKMAAEDPRFRKMPVWDPTEHGDLTADQRAELQDAVGEQRLAMMKAGAAYNAYLNQYGVASLEELIPRLSTEDFKEIEPILDLSAYTQSPRRYAEGGPVYNAPPDAASAESALGRYRDYMVQAQQMGLPTIPFERFAQIQEAAGPVQRYAMGGALHAHAANASKMASSGMLVDVQGLQEQALANEVRGQNIDWSKNQADNQTSRDNNALDNQTSRQNNTADNKTARFNTMAENPNAVNLSADLKENTIWGFNKSTGQYGYQSPLDFAQGGPVPGALDRAQQAPSSSPKYVVDPDPNAPVDSIPAVIDDQQPARLNSGEFVFPTDVVQFYGLDRLNKMIAAARRGQEMQGA